MFSCSKPNNYTQPIQLIAQNLTSSYTEIPTTLEVLNRAGLSYKDVRELYEEF